MFSATAKTVKIQRSEFERGCGGVPLRWEMPVKSQRVSDLGHHHSPVQPAKQGDIIMEFIHLWPISIVVLVVLALAVAALMLGLAEYERRRPRPDCLMCHNFAGISMGIRTCNVLNAVDRGNSVFTSKASTEIERSAVGRCGPAGNYFESNNLGDE